MQLPGSNRGSVVAGFAAPCRRANEVRGPRSNTSSDMDSPGIMWYNHIPYVLVRSNACWPSARHWRGGRFRKERGAMVRGIGPPPPLWISNRQRMAAVKKDLA